LILHWPSASHRRSSPARASRSYKKVRYCY